MTDVYFLGGHDAEMLEIRNMLEASNVPYFDKQLKWGAQLSKYQQELDQLEPNQRPVFVELKLDCAYPEHAVIIDHHGERAGKNQLTAIAQTAKRLRTSLNRHQQLISINDRAHIRGMKAFGASHSEIETIRALDRKAQGVTDDDEKKALKTIQENIRILCPDVAIVKSLCERTSCVVDRIHDRFKHLFVFSPDGNAHYFGPGEIVFALRDMVHFAQKNDPALEVWYGGDLPEIGFLGTTFQLSDTHIHDLLCVSG